jgi:hypothetical protein
MKICGKCGVEKNLSDFTKRKASKDGLNPYCKLCAANYQLNWRMAEGNKEKKKKYEDARHAANPEKRKEKAMKANYGITLEQYNTMWKLQKESCGICGAKETKGKGFHIDHDHKTGKVRGILCNQCNLGLGHFNDNVAKMLLAIEYLGRAA